MEANELGILKDRFKGFEYPVDENVWSRIELNSPKPKNIIWKPLSIAAGIALAVVIGQSFDQELVEEKELISISSNPATKEITENHSGQKTTAFESASLLATSPEENTVPPVPQSEESTLFNDDQITQIIPAVDNGSFEEMHSDELMSNLSESEGKSTPTIEPQFPKSQGSSVKIQLVFANPVGFENGNQKSKVNFGKLKRNLKREINLKKMKDKAKSIFVFGKKNKKAHDESEPNNSEVNIN